ncbi:hypothetical protein ES702_02865 [subsurface metagenome]
MFDKILTSGGFEDHELRKVVVNDGLLAGRTFDHRLELLRMIGQIALTSLRSITDDVGKLAYYICCFVEHNSLHAKRSCRIYVLKLVVDEHSGRWAGRVLDLFQNISVEAEIRLSHPDLARDEDVVEYRPITI